MTDKTETVILIHGLWMHGFVMLPQQHWLTSHGYSVGRFSYHSRRDSLDDNVRLLSRFISKTSGSTIHIVAHSLGGLVALKMLSQEHDPRIHRVVLMGTPYESCHCGLALAGVPFLTTIVGQTFKDWFNLPCPELPPSQEIGIIAGTRPLGLGRLIPGLPHPNDGVVAVKETRIGDAKDFITLNVNHAGMLVSRACAEQIYNFLRSGNFIHA